MLISASPVKAARSGPGAGKDGAALRDPEAGLHVKKGSRLKGACGYSVHYGCGRGRVRPLPDGDAGQHPRQPGARPAVVEGRGALYADAAYGSRRPEGSDPRTPR